jgi:hypothetical protein
MAYTQLQLQRWTGSSWEQFGEVLGAEQKQQMRAVRAAFAARTAD